MFNLNKISESKFLQVEKTIFLDLHSHSLKKRGQFSYVNQKFSTPCREMINYASGRIIITWELIKLIMYCQKVFIKTSSLVKERKAKKKKWRKKEEELSRSSRRKRRRRDESKGTCFRMSIVHTIISSTIYIFNGALVRRMSRGCDSSTGHHRKFVRTWSPERDPFHLPTPWWNAGEPGDFNAWRQVQAMSAVLGPTLHSKDIGCIHPQERSLLIPRCETGPPKTSFKYI